MAPRTLRRVALLTAGGYAPCLSSAVGGPDRALHRSCSRRRDHRLPPRLPRRADRHVRRRRRLGAGRRAGAAQVRRQPDRQQPGEARPTPRTWSSAASSRRARTRCRWRPSSCAADGVDVLHTIGGDDTNTTAADLAAFLHERDYDLTVVGLPKTIDNDVIPIRQSLGAWTAAEQGAVFAQQRAGRARLQPADAHRPRGDGPGLRLADRRGGGAVPGVARRPEWDPGIGLDAGALGHPRGVRARGPDRHGRRGRAAARGDGRDRLRQHLPVRGRRRTGDRRRHGGRRRGDPARPVRPREAGHRSTRARGSPSSSPSGSGPRRRWCRRAATSPVPPRPTRPTGR